MRNRERIYIHSYHQFSFFKLFMQKKKKNPYGYGSISVNRNTVYMSLFLEEGE